MKQETWITEPDGNMQLLNVYNLQTVSGENDGDRQLLNVYSL